MRAKLGSVIVVASALAGLVVSVQMGCDNGSGVVEGAPTTDAGTGTVDTGSQTPVDSGPGTKDCFDNPKTHEEIINACTDAAKIEKHPVLPRLGPNGELPPL
jgi:hypothetical protein